MIQRVQSVYLLMMAGLMIALLFYPLGVFTAEKATYEFAAFSVRDASGGNLPGFPIWTLGVLSVLTVLLSLFTLLLFTRRMAQIRICVFNGILLASFYLVYIAFVFIVKSKFDAQFMPSFAASMPLIALILDILAIKAIGKDEALIQSWNRIR